MNRYPVIFAGFFLFSLCVNSNVTELDIERWKENNPGRLPVTHAQLEDADKGCVQAINCTCIVHYSYDPMRQKKLRFYFGDKVVLEIPINGMEAFGVETGCIGCSCAIRDEIRIILSAPTPVRDFLRKSSMGAGGSLGHFCCLGCDRSLFGENSEGLQRYHITRKQTSCGFSPPSVGMRCIMLHPGHILESEKKLIITPLPESSLIDYAASHEPIVPAYTIGEDDPRGGAASVDPELVQGTGFDAHRDPLSTEWDPYMFFFGSEPHLPQMSAMGGAPSS